MGFALEYDLASLNEDIRKLKNAAGNMQFPAETSDTNTSGGGSTLGKVNELITAYNTLLQEISNLYTVTASYLSNAAANMEAADQACARNFQ